MKTVKPKDYDLSVEILFLEGLHQRLTDDVEVLKHLGDDYTTIGRWEDGLKVDLKLLQLLPGDPLVHYNLACSFSLLKQTKDASEALTKAISLGYRDWQWLKEDSDLEYLRKSSDYEQVALLIEHLPESKLDTD